MKAFQHEARAYTWLIPEMQKVRSDRKLKPLAFPRCFYASPEDSLLVIENAKSRGFEVIEKKPQRECYDFGLGGHS
jgi:hypothetical protein